MGMIVARPAKENFGRPDGSSYRVDAPVESAPAPKTFDRAEVNQALKALDAATAPQLLELIKDLSFPQPTQATFDRLKNQLTELVTKTNLREAVARSVANNLDQPAVPNVYTDRFDITPLATAASVANRDLTLGNAVAELIDIKDQLKKLLTNLMA